MNPRAPHRSGTIYRILVFLFLVVPSISMRGSENSYSTKGLEKWNKFVKFGQQYLTSKKWKNIDTTYIQPEKYAWSVYLNTFDGEIQTKVSMKDVQLQTLAAYGITESMDVRVKMRTGTSERVGLSVGYRGLTLSFSVDVQSYCSKDFCFRSYGKKFGGDIRYHTTKNMNGSLEANFDRERMKAEVEGLIDRLYDEYEGARSKESIGKSIADTLMKVGILDHQGGSYNKKPFEVNQGDSKVSTIIGNAYFCPNSKRFSYPAALSNEFRQKRSAGSFLTTAAFMHLDLEANSEKMKQLTGGIKDLTINQMAVGAGYAYNWVLARSRLLLHGSFTAGPLFLNRNRVALADNEVGYTMGGSELIDRLEKNTLNLIFVGRLAAKYRFNDHFFLGAQSLVNSFRVGRKKDYTMTTTDWLARIYLTYRF